MEKHIMRRIAACVLAATLSLPMSSLVAQTPTPQTPVPTTATINGTALGSTGQPMPNTKVQLRNLVTGQLAGTTTSSGIGQFAFLGLQPGIYAIEVVTAVGQIVALSAPIAVAAGITAAGVTVVASASQAGLIGAAAAAGGLASSASGAAGMSTAVVVTTVAAAAQVAGVVVPVARVLASPSQ